jgi:hypothetical protein
MTSTPATGTSRIFVTRHHWRPIEEDVAILVEYLMEGWQITYWAWHRGAIAGWQLERSD